MRISILLTIIIGLITTTPYSFAETDKSLEPIEIGVVYSFSGAAKLWSEYNLRPPDSYKERTAVYRRSNG